LLFFSQDETATRKQSPNMPGDLWTESTEGLLDSVHCTLVYSTGIGTSPFRLYSARGPVNIYPSGPAGSSWERYSHSLGTAGCKARYSRVQVGEEQQVTEI
jgi:hypothetical protein